ncbi:MAG: UDP-glucose/GDP-mannose dehydrogenase family protein [Flavobacteriales bacterium]|nr:UDP-glucose/GDP-mannose dehydrogenase family protein [Flavobacteriales bacterium]
MNIAVVGTGYVGLVTGTCLADTGNNVICVDIDTAKVEKLKNGEVPIYEPQLDILFHRNIKQNRLSFTTNLKEAVDQSQIIFLALPTPQGEDGSADLSYILKVADDLGKIITDYKIIVDKSTVPVGTSEKVEAAVKANAKVDFDVVSNPEFLREGFAVEDFLKPDRVVIGSSSDKAKAIMKDLYRPYVRQGNPIIFMDEKSAELTKYAANAFLATKITFMNEIANYCEKVGADADMIRIGMGTDTRIGKRFLFPGIGYGGSCFPKDVQALQKSGMDMQHEFKILNAVLEVNDKQRIILADKIKSYYGDDLTGKKFAVWGLAFKPDTDDIREAPALYIIDELLKAGATAKVYDQEAMENVKAELGDKVEYAADQYACLEDCDALIIATEWPAFRTPDFENMSNGLKHKVIFDGRNLYDLSQMENQGFYYSSIGRKLIQ